MTCGHAAKEFIAAYSKFKGNILFTGTLLIATTDFTDDTDCS